MISFTEYQSKYGVLQAVASFDVFVNEKEKVIRKRLLVPYPYWNLIFLHRLAIKLAKAPLQFIVPTDRALKSYKGSSVMSIEDDHYRFYELASDISKIREANASH